jgi:hypothetical protein
MEVKGNAETKTIKVPGPTSTDKLTPKIPIKRKENGKGFTGKGKGKGKPRKKDFNERNNQDNGTKPVTNNMQKAYLDETHCLGDDEITIIFTQNATRIIATTENEDKEDDDETTTKCQTPS